MDEQRLIGMWWLATDSNREHKIGGTLLIDEEGRVKLDLTHELIATRSGGNSNHPSDEPVLIHGAAQGKRITLINCRETNGSRTSMGQEHTTTQVLRAEASLIGIHLQNPDEAVFSGIRVQLSHMNKWADKSGIRADFVWADEHGHDSGPLYTGTIEGIDAEHASLPQKGIEATLCWRQNMTLDARTTAWDRQLHAAERVELHLQSLNPLPWSGFIDIYGGMQDLITLATQSACVIGSKQLELSTDDVPTTTVDLHYHGSNTTVKDEPRQFDVLFSLADMAPFAESFPTWMALRDKLGMPLDILLGLDYMPSGYYENQLFNAGSAAEGIHAALRPQTTALDITAHHQVKKVVKDALKSAVRDDHIDDATRQWATNSIGSNHPGLKLRCLELAKIPDQTAVTTLLGNVDYWARWVRDTRNAIGHATAGSEQKIPETARYRLLSITKALLHLVLMNELGLPPEVQQRAVTQLWGYQAAQFRKATIAAAATKT
ncbi:hypothetical protein QNA24_28440 [Rhodococcus qingshengii]|uniref:ApeA N-terminal domain 1-containing protein n=1 Tax=Rhodococcus qingshengii TaxID=334542 RepID=UPI0024BBA466|nr:HEPN domain-containing protein [Rhodococcus qingshengii]MDJ0490311.1 hypothetical protein [Rhodococcus qingshengii]